MIDLGATIPLTVSTFDATGNLSDPATVVLTVTLPDGSTDTPAVVHTSTGVYTCQYVTTQAGRHQVRWISTNPATSYADVFNVAEASPAMLISLAEARAALAKRTGSSTVGDSDLRGYIVAATPIVEDAAGAQRILTKTFTANGGAPSILIPDNIVSVLSITESGAALTAGSDYTVDFDRGIITRGTYRMGFYFTPGIQNVVIVYKTGVGLVADNVRLATRIIVAHLWQADQQGSRPAIGGSAPNADVVTTPSGFAIPRRAAELLRPSTDSVEMPGFA